MNYRFAQFVRHRHQVGHYWVLNPTEETLSVSRWHPDGYLEVLAAGGLYTAGRTIAYVALAALLSLPRLFAADHADGTLEQMLVAPQPLALLERAVGSGDETIVGRHVIVATGSKRQTPRLTSGGSKRTPNCFAGKQAPPRSSPSVRRPSG